MQQLLQFYYTMCFAVLLTSVVFSAVDYWTARLRGDAPDLTPFYATSPYWYITLAWSTPYVNILVLIAFVYFRSYGWYRR